jgi:hypothetical protein
LGLKAERAGREGLSDRSQKFMQGAASHRAHKRTRGGEVEG